MKKVKFTHDAPHFSKGQEVEVTPEFADYLQRCVDRGLAFDMDILTDDHEPQEAIDEPGGGHEESKAEHTGESEPHQEELNHDESEHTEETDEPETHPQPVKQFTP